MAALTYYVELDGSSGSGTEGSPYDAAQFRSHFNALSEGPTGNSHIYKLKGSTEYVWDNSAEDSMAAFFNHNKDPITIESWEDTPAMIMFSPTASGDLAGAFAFGESGAVGDGTHKINRVILQVTNPKIIVINNSHNAADTILENCMFAVDGIFGDANDARIFETTSFSMANTHNISGCSFINLSSSTIREFIRVETADGTWQLNVNSCYFDGKSQYIETVVNSFNDPYAAGINKYSAIYNNSEYVGWTRGGSTMSSSNNIVADSTGSQISNLTDILLLSLPNDLYPIAGSPIIDAGDPSLGLSVDIFNVSRSYDPNPDIGVSEFQISTINTFDITPAADGVEVTSTINLTTMITQISAAGPDAYFDADAEFTKVIIYYTHVDGRQKKKIKHTISGEDLVGTTSWSTGAKTGIWQMTSVRSYDTDGATSNLTRSDLGSDYDITIS